MAFVLCVNKAAPSYPGGAETRLREVARRWVSAGHRVVVLCAKTERGEQGISFDEGIEIRRISVLPETLLRFFPRPHYLPQALFYFVGPSSVLWVAVREKPDYVRDSMSPYPALSFLAPWLGRKGIVVLHILFGGFRGWKEFYPAPYAVAGALAERLLLGGRLGYKAVVADSPWVANRIRALAPTLRVESIANGVELDVPRRKPKGRIFRLINAARMIRHKDQESLIEACGILSKEGVRVTLDIFGGGPLESSLKQKVEEAGLDHTVRVLPALSHQALLESLADYDAYILPSVSEGLPVVMLEAMAAELPVVVADRPYSRDLVEPELVCFYDPASPRGLAMAIAEVVARPLEAESRAIRARTFVEQFTWNRTAEMEWRLLETVTRAGRKN